jgi:lysophospholipase L1-like esterase
MKKLTVMSLCAALTLAGQLFAQNAPDKKPAPSQAQNRQAPDVAAPKLGNDGKPEVKFMQKHHAFVQRAKQGKVDLLFLGDSITEGWGAREHIHIWDGAFGKYNPANFGIGGDRTQHVLWRILNGELEGIKPKTIVLMIGTNNSKDDSAEGIASGITKIVGTIREKLPKSKILLLGVFPRGDSPNPQREKLQQVNATISKLDNGKNVFYLDIGNSFVESDGTIRKEIMPDFLHLSPEGYQRWADAIRAKLAKLM